MLLLSVLYLALFIGIWKVFRLLCWPLGPLWRHVIRRPLNFQSRYGSGWVVITGGTDGLGRGYAEYFAARKFSILLIDNNRAQLSEVSNQIAKRFSVPVATIDADLSTYPVNQKLFTQLYAQIKQKTRKEAIKGLVNAYSIQYRAPFKDMNNEHIDGMINSNIVPTAHITRALVEDLQVSRSAFMIFTSSYSCIEPLANEAVYAGTMTYSRLFGLDLGMELDGIDVLVVEPFESSQGDIKSTVEYSLRELGRGRETAGSRGDVFKHWWNSTAPGFCKIQNKVRTSDSNLNIKKKQ